MVVAGVATGVEVTSEAGTVAPSHVRDVRLLFLICCAQSNRVRLDRVRLAYIRMSADAACVTLAYTYPLVSVRIWHARIQSSQGIPP